MQDKVISQNKKGWNLIAHLLLTCFMRFLLIFEMTILVRFKLTLEARTVSVIYDTCKFQVHTGTGDNGFDPGPRHTKVIRNGTSCSSLGTQAFGVELWMVDPVSELYDWYHVKCLGHDTSVRLHYKSEQCAPCRNQTPSIYDWKFVESDAKPKQQQ